MLALAAATCELTNNIVVAPYLFEVRDVNGKIVPVKEREIIRAAGPTVHPHTGKQASARSMLNPSRVEPNMQTAATDLTRALSASGWNSSPARSNAA